MTLPESPLGAELRVIGVRLPEDDALRLNQMGLRLGTRAHVTQQVAFGPRDDESMSCRAAVQSAHVPRSGLVSVHHQRGEGRELRSQGWPLRGQDATCIHVSEVVPPHA